MVGKLFHGELYRGSRALVVALLLGTGVAVADATAQEADPFEAYRCESAYRQGDYATAFPVCRRVAKAGVVDAQVMLANLYRRGAGVARDMRQAALWYRRDAEQGNGEARFNLATMYRYGIGVERDPVEALAWFDLAAEAGHPDAAAARDLVASDMTAAQIAAADRRRARLGGAPATPTQAKPSTETVAEVQRLLARLGYDPGPADGVPGRKTETAIARYQRDAGLPVDGRASASLRQRLASAVAPKITPTPSPAPTPAVTTTATAPAPPASSITPSAASPTAGTLALVDALKAAVGRAETAGGADPTLIAALKRLIAAHDWPWRVAVLDDTFADGDYTSGVGWVVDSGSLAVRPGLGLWTRFAPPAAATASPAKQKKKPKDAAAQLFGAILSEIAKPSGGSASTTTATPKPPSSAAFHVAAPFANAFAIALELRVLAANGSADRLAFGPYTGGPTGGPGGAGYRLALIGGATPAFELIRIDGGGAVVIARQALATPLADGAAHRIVWRRAGDGRMTVLLDSGGLLDVVDRRLTGAFSGVAFVNSGGEYAIGRVTVRAAGG